MFTSRKLRLKVKEIKISLLKLYKKSYENEFDFDLCAI